MSFYCPDLQKSIWMQSWNAKKTKTKTKHVLAGRLNKASRPQHTRLTWLVSRPKICTWTQRKPRVMQLHERKYISAYIVVTKQQVFITFLLLKPLLISKMSDKNLANGADNVAEEENMEKEEGEIGDATARLSPVSSSISLSCAVLCSREQSVVPLRVVSLSRQFCSLNLPQPLTLWSCQGLDTPLYQLAWHILIASLQNVACQTTVVLLTQTHCDLPPFDGVAPGSRV